MARKRAHDTDGTFVGDNPETPQVNEAWQETEDVAISDPEPVNLEIQSPDPEPIAAPPAPEKVEVETDVRTKLTTRTEENNPFVPTSPAVLEAAAKKVAEEEGFELNRGTSIGARLLARSRKMV